MRPGEESPLKRAVDKFEIEMHSKLKDRMEVPSRYEFLKGHNGLRPNCLHGIIGTTGCGKSTLFKCIIAETAAEKPVLVWLSEENVVEYQELINFLDEECLDNIMFVEEKEIAESYKVNQDVFLEYFEQLVEESGAEFVFIDNVTSSCFYNQRFGFSGQNRSAEFLRNFVKRKCSIFYVSHTSTNITDNYGKVINSEDIRGSKELPIVTEYLYIIQKFTTNDKQYNVLRVAKFRHHQEAAGWFALTYENKAYIGDSRVPFNLINKIFKSRDYLGKKDAKTTK
jgi:predicted ATP-dependent serine protease